MKQKDLDEILKKIAKREGITVDEVRKEMQIAIDDARNSKDPHAQKQWAKLGKNPSIETVINSLSKNILN